MFYDNDPCDNHDGAFDTQRKDAWQWSDTDDNALDSMTEDMVITMRAGQLRAMLAWRQLTNDPKTWPAEGQLVATLNHHGRLDAHPWFNEVDGRAVGALYLTHWYPLPPTEPR